MDSFDVTIVGAGLAGLQCARLLGQSGRRVLLLDRKNSLTRNIHTTGIFVRRTLTDFDIPEDCLGPAIRDVTLYSPRHRPLELKSKHDEFRIGRMTQFLIESGLLCVLGGLIGLAISWGVCLLITNLAGITMTITIGYIFLALAVSTIIGVLSGIYPAFKGSRLDPIVALTAAM